METSWGKNVLRGIVLSLLAVSTILNVLAIQRISLGSSIDDSRYTYVGDNFPVEMPVRLDIVSMEFEDVAADEHYSQTGLNAWLEWHTIDHFPRAHGFVTLGPDGRQFGVSMFHQLHCLEMIREAMINGADAHAAHCFNFLRQAVLCNADITLESGGQATHTCRDWTQAYDFITVNQEGWPAKRNETMG